MSIFITGDTHGRWDFGKLLSRNFDDLGLTKDDYLIICGDFGLVWYPPENRIDANAVWYANTLKWLSDRPYTTLFIDGNHENFDLLDAYPVEEWHGGLVHRISDTVLHLMRGHVFEIDGRTFFTMGGATSIDKDRRTAGRSWWPQESIGEGDMDVACENLEKNGWDVDYVLTHDCPTNARPDLTLQTGWTYAPDPNADALQTIADKLAFKQWFFGHHHADIKHFGIDGKYNALYNLIFDLDTDDWSNRILTNPRDRIENKDELPPSSHKRGYTIKELAQDIGLDEDRVWDAMKYDMHGSTMGVNDDGELIIYKHDVNRVLDWC